MTYIIDGEDNDNGIRIGGRYCWLCVGGWWCPWIVGGDMSVAGVVIAGIIWLDDITQDLL